MIRLTVVSFAVGALLVATAELAAQVCVGNGIGGPQAHYASGSFRSGDDVTGWGFGAGVRIAEAVGVELSMDRDSPKDVDWHHSTAAIEVSARVLPGPLPTCIIAGGESSWARPGSEWLRSTQWPVGVSTGYAWEMSGGSMIIASAGARHIWFRGSVADVELRDTVWMGRGSLALYGGPFGIEVTADHPIGEGTMRPLFRVVLKAWDHH